MLPGSVEYEAAVQNPSLRFVDPDLKRCIPERLPIGTVRVRSGGFAYTYRMDPRAGSGQTSWAVRCFHQEVPNLRQRYEAISRHLRSVNLACLTEFRYLDPGIQVNGHWFPIVKMPWITGSTLCVYIAKHLSRPSVLRDLAQRIRNMARELEDARLAHGDIQDGNIIVQLDGSLKLVDYDSFYVPALQGLLAGNRGVADFQHPRRTDQDFSPNMDRFSFLVLYLGIAGTAERPELWRTFSPGDANILLKQQDFLHPDSSKVLSELEQIPRLAAFVRTFRSICRASFDQIPSLDDVIVHKRVLSVPSHALTPVTPWSSPYPIVKATDRDRLLALEGQVVEVVGLVDYVYYDPTRYTKQGTRYAHINFGKLGEGMFDIPLWWEALAPLLQASHDPREFEGRWVSITGLVSVYRKHDDPSWRPQPQIVPDWYGKIEILAGKDKAQARLRSHSDLRLSQRAPARAGAPRRREVPASPAQVRGRASKGTADATEQDILNSIYGAWKQSPASPARSPSPVSPAAHLAGLIKRVWEIIRL